ncbi:pentatricopeptide repeat domain-containing protein 3, mitochondrial-like [Dreissena polymorpha]|uniref:pentatricopeptide repeat domain-containing protein 3, mitochondrial-like n=1 Tax=Dreissena polymorpha TaxID=45954 RepID=UPI0022650864|nr:pentatricopeptide repeat domain-containing protein 3, mitochondrial-like [Dreissena polymorpha]
MAKASGKRAAQYFVNKHSDLFGHNDARPHIPGFQPRAQGYNVNDVGEKALMERVDRRAVSHAVEVYDRMSEQGLKLSQEGRMRLLELLCAYQCQDPVHDIFPEERLAQPDNRTTRKHMDKAMEVFEGIETRTADTYNWIIRGLAQAGDSRCWTLFEEMEVEEFTADLGTFNDLLNQMGREASTNRSFDEVKNVLKKMTAAGVRPDLETFHGMLRFLKCLMPKDGYLGNKVVANVRQVLAEMRELDIEPSLETWSLVLDTLIVVNKESGFWSTVQRNHEPAKDILEIVEYLKKQSPEKVVMDHLGENFFTKSMSYLSRRYIVEAAKVLFELRESMGLRYVTTDLHMENNYYEAFFLLLIKEETLEVAMDYYVKYIRNGRLTSSTNYTRFRLYKEIYNNNAYHWIPLIYADQSAAGSARFLMLGEEIMEMMSRKDVPPELHHDFETIADEFLERNKQVFNVFNDVKRPHIVMSYHIRIYVNLGQLQKAWDVVKVYTSRTQFLGYDLMPLVLKELLEKTAENLEFELLMYLVEMDANYRPMFVKPMEELLVTYGDLLETNLTKTKMDELRAFIKKSQF